MFCTSPKPPAFWLTGLERDVNDWIKKTGTKKRQLCRNIRQSDREGQPQLKFGMRCKHFAEGAKRAKEKVYESPANLPLLFDVGFRVFRAITQTHCCFYSTPA